MRRIRIAWLILILTAALCLTSHFAVRRVMETVHAQLNDIRLAGEAGDYSRAEQKAKALTQYYGKRQHLLEIFIRRDTVGAASVSLNGLAAYAREDTVRDLCSEIDKAQEQIRAMEHLFFSVF